MGRIPALHGVVRWRLIDLAQWLFEEFRVSIFKPTLSRELRHMGFRKLSARPRHHAQDEEAAAAKKTFSPWWRKTRRQRSSGKPIEISFSRRSSDRAEKQGHPPMGETRDTAFGAARTQEQSPAYIFGAICPAKGERRRACPPLLQQRGHGPASRRNLACGRTKRAYALVLLDQAEVACLGEASRSGQHHALAVAAEIARAESVENIWQFMRDNWLSNRVFNRYDDVFDHCCFALEQLIEGMPWKIISHRNKSGPIGRDQRDLV